MNNNIFENKTVYLLIERINNLTLGSQPKWGKMNVSQMLAHCNVVYEMHYEKIHLELNFFTKTMMKLFVKKIVVSDKPYKKNNRTAPLMLINKEKNFEDEKKRLIKYIEDVQKLGENHFNGMESYSFGKLTSQEWNNLFYKHLDHHLNQFNV